MREPNWIANPSHTREIMDTHGLHMKKSLGQNFLIEPNILRKMIQEGGVHAGSHIIEVGPGIGALTEFLAYYGGEVHAFEIDARFVAVLEETLSAYDNVKLYPQDILQVDFSEAAFDPLRQASDLLLVANLPYYITTAIISHFLQSDLPIQRYVLMMQKEVAQRLSAQVGSKAYSSLTLAIQNHLQLEGAFTVPRTVFIPRPHVDSAVLILSRRPQAIVQVEDDSEFQAFVQACFSQRRKTLWNNLKRVELDFMASAQAEDLAQVLEDSGISGQRRSETLTLEEFGFLYQSLKVRFGDQPIG